MRLAGTSDCSRNPTRSAVERDSSSARRFCWLVHVESPRSGVHPGWTTQQLVRTRAEEETKASESSGSRHSCAADVRERGTLGNLVSVTRDVSARRKVPEEPPWQGLEPSRAEEGKGDERKPGERPELRREQQSTTALADNGPHTDACILW